MCTVGVMSRHRSSPPWPDAERPADMFTSTGALRLEYVNYIVHRFREFEVFEIQSRQSTGRITVEIAETQLGLADASLIALSRDMLEQGVELLPSTVLMFIAKNEMCIYITRQEERKTAAAFRRAAIIFAAAVSDASCLLAVKPSWPRRTMCGPTPATRAS